MSELSRDGGVLLLPTRRHRDGLQITVDNAGNTAADDLA